MESIRTFIAVDVEPTPSLIAVLGELQRMGRPLRVVGASQLHVTLRFLGNIEPVRVGDAEASLQEAVNEVLAFELRIVGLGAFPHARRARVVWAGLRGAEPLGRIADRLDNELERRGLPARDRAWQPHLTLARVNGRPPRALASLLNEHPETQFGQQRVEAVHLFRSELTPQGALHTVLASRAL